MTILMAVKKGSNIELIAFYSMTSLFKYFVIL